MIFAKLCIEKNEKFLYYIHQDESTIQGDKHANRQWFRMSNNETRHGLVGKYKHEIKAHVGPFNTISWRFQGEPVELEALVKYYLSEFVKNSSR